MTKKSKNQSLSTVCFVNKHSWLWFEEKFVFVLEIEEKVEIWKYLALASWERLSVGQFSEQSRHNSLSEGRGEGKNSQKKKKTTVWSLTRWEKKKKKRESSAVGDDQNENDSAAADCRRGGGEGASGRDRREIELRRQRKRVSEKEKKTVCFTPSHLLSSSFRRIAREEKCSLVSLKERTKNKTWKHI